ncbi:MAG: hypothetical protein COV47_05165 [Candidatus Diapherotrites archaeon CG11_big_fil_rev_8_21_14_0_20_37_9]|nr:MAG: hypothetical protein COV47_05165 [Candidatus Diapherotrites archaeon CG11_big_fil_rev_8_21_14_0_20_37_9]
MKNSLRVLFDTNIYGLILELDKQELAEKVINSDKVTVYGLDVIRKELREIPKNLKHEKKSFRGKILVIYDAMVKKHGLKTTRLVEALTEEYLREYKGGISKKKLENDFLIVAFASLRSLDIIVSEDNHSMISSNAMKAYEKVNSANGLRKPVFHSLKEFEKLL